MNSAASEASVPRYAKPVSIDEALARLTEGRWRILAGGTDFYPALGARPLREDVLDINGLAGLRGISSDEGYLRIGARTTWSEVLRADLPPALDALKLAAREVGSVQIQNSGTVAGNLCNASPAADGVPPLLVLDAEVELRSAGATRRLTLPEFIQGNRRTALRPGEMMTAVLVPKRSMTGRSAFLKLGARRYLVISIAMAAVRISVENGRIAEAAVSVGACSPVALRLPEAERALVGQPAAGPAIDAIPVSAFNALSPIDDVRGSAGYRREAAREIVGRAVAAALAGSAVEAPVAA
jgi:CO/xanthine dehydrogenase FAD-binding subunit